MRDPIPRRTFATAAALALLLPCAAGATTLLAVDLDELVERAGAIVVARVVAAESAWDDDHRRIYTTVEIEVEEAWTGAKAGERMKLRRPGGIVGDVGQRVHGLRELVPGERAVLFLQPAPTAPDRWSLVGMDQGRLDIRVDPKLGEIAEQRLEGMGLARLEAPRKAVPLPEGAVTPLRLPMDELRARVRAALKSRDPGGR